MENKQEQQKIPLLTLPPTLNVELCKEPQNSQSNFERKGQSWTTLTFQFQNLPQDCNNQDCVVLTKGQTDRHERP